MKLATLCYLSHVNKTLMLYRSEGFMSDTWTAPGGKWESGETITACALREYVEETGLTLHDMQFKGTILFDNTNRIFRDGKKGQEDYLVYVYTATTFTGILQQPSKGTLEWIATTELPKLRMEKGDEYLLKLLPVPGIFEARIWHDEQQNPCIDASIYHESQHFSISKLL